MLLRRFYDEKLAQASYLLGCQAAGLAVVVDPNRDVAPYLRAAAAEGLRISHVTETHIHADFASGARELAERTGALLMLSDEGGADWKYSFAAESGARLLVDGDVFMVGNLKLEVWHTPGHTPEHLSFLVTDTVTARQPIGALTGDFIFVGDVGRPDLLEKAAGLTGTMEVGARALFHSLQRFMQLPDHIQVWPGHGAGSACGKSLGAVPTSTLGYERIANWGFQVRDEDEFVKAVLSGQPDPPRYFAMMKRLNKHGPRVLGEFVTPPRLNARDLHEALRQGAPVIDIRTALDYAGGHVPGTLNIPENRAFTNWAGWLLPYDQPLILIGAPERVAEAVRDLATIGLDDIAGAADTDVLAEWASTGLPLGRVPRATVHELAAEMAAGSPVIVDVRSADEWADGHIPGSLNEPLGHLRENVADLAGRGPVYLTCQSGSRSAIGASILLTSGLGPVLNLEGGVYSWRDAGFPLELGAPVATPS